MTDALWLVIAVVGATLAYMALAYNRFVDQRNTIENSWSNVDTELNRRYDLVPNLVETVKGYAAHERTTLEAVTVARREAMADQGPPEAQAESERPLVGALRKLLAVAENYPELKASTHFMSLQDELVHTEDRIQAARRFYNANVRDYNTRVEAIPSSLIAKMFGFRRLEFFNVEPAVREVPTVDAGA
jgi:LemA protein